MDVTRAEARQSFVAAAEASYMNYKETGLHITSDEMSENLSERTSPTRDGQLAAGAMLCGTLKP